MPLIQERTYTTEDIYALPEGQRQNLLTDRYMIWRRPCGRLVLNIADLLS